MHRPNQGTLAKAFQATGVTIEVAGTVVWADERRQGIQFTKLSAKAQQDIRQLIADVEQDEG